MRFILCLRSSSCLHAKLRFLEKLKTLNSNTQKSGKLKTKYVFFYRKYFEIIQDLTGMKSPITTELKKILTKWVSKKFGFNVEDVIPYYSEERATVRDVLQKNNRWEEMNQR